MNARIATPALMLAALLPCAGCAGLDKASECREVARLVNPVLADIDHERTTVRAASYRGIAVKYEELATTLEKLKLRTKHVAEAVNDYEHMLHEASRDAKAFADALDAKDEARVVIIHGAAARTIRHEATAWARLEVSCRPSR